MTIAPDDIETERLRAELATALARAEKAEAFLRDALAYAQGDGWDEDKMGGVINILDTAVAQFPYMNPPTVSHDDRP